MYHRCPTTQVRALTSDLYLSAGCRRGPADCHRGVDLDEMYSLTTLVAPSQYMIPVFPLSSAQVIMAALEVYGLIHIHHKQK